METISKRGFHKGGYGSMDCAKFNGGTQNKKIFSPKVTTLQGRWTSLEFDKHWVDKNKAYYYKIKFFAIRNLKQIFCKTTKIIQNLTIRIDFETITSWLLWPWDRSNFADNT